MTVYAPVFIDTSQADCHVLSAAALLFTAPIVLPILGVVHAVERYKNYRRTHRAKKAIKTILQDAFDDKDTKNDKDILAKWTHHDMTYVVLDGALYSTRHDVLKQIKEHDGKVVIYIVDPFKVRLHHLVESACHGSDHIKIYNMYDAKLYKNYENDVITLKDGYYGILGKRFTIEYLDDSPSNHPYK